MNDIVTERDNIIYLYIILNLDKREVSYLLHYSVRTLERRINKYKIRKPGFLLLFLSRRNHYLLYGVENPFQVDKNKEKIRNTCIERYGVVSPNKNRRILNKGLETKKRNHTVNTSRPENEVYEKLLTKFERVCRQYKSDKYPFLCDFYIGDLDLYIEYQGNWTHGKHPFDSNSIEDVIIVEKWNKKATRYYESAIDVWTKRDPLKRKTAKDNNLNWIEFFSMEEFMKWFDLF